MCPLRLVADDRAGPTAIGILVPPSRRTFLIVRPRSLSFDLLVLAAAGSTAFREFEHEQANRAAEALFDALGACWGSDSVQAEFLAAGSDGFHLTVRVGPFHLLACRRQPGQPYAPLPFSDIDSVRAAAARVLALLSPPSGVEQEIYLNTRHFQR
jgi:hypothetical protein